MKKIIAIVLLLSLMASIPAAAAPDIHEVNARSRYHMGGLMTQLGKELYYIEANAIYKATLSGENQEQVYEGVAPEGLQAHNGYIYFYDSDEDGASDGIYRFGPGEAPAKFVKGDYIYRSENYVIANNALYYCEYYGDFYRVDLETGKVRQIDDGLYEHGLTMQSCINGVIYFSGNDSDTPDYKYDTETDKKLVKVSYTLPTYAHGEYFYAAHEDGVERFKLDQKTGEISDRKAYTIDDAYEYFSYFFLSDDAIYFVNISYDESTKHRTDLLTINMETGESRLVYQSEGELRFMPTSEYIWIFEDRSFREYALLDKLTKARL